MAYQLLETATATAHADFWIHADFVEGLQRAVARYDSPEVDKVCHRIPGSASIL